MATVPRCTRRSKVQRSRQAQRRRPRRSAPLPGPLLRVVEALLQAFAAAFTRPTYERFVVLLLAAILTTGCRTVLNLLRTVEVLAPGHPSSYHRVFSQRRCSLWSLGQAFAGFILRRWVAT